MLLTLYFFVLGVLCVSNLLRPFVTLLLPACFPNSNYHAQLNEGKGESKKIHVDYEFDRIDLVCLVFAALFGVWYLLKKHWIANNIFGLAFSLTGVELLHLNRYCMTKNLSAFSIFFKGKSQFIFTNIASNEIFLFFSSFPIGCILLGGLFFYDIFWVFGTNVMVTVATSFEAPIKCKLNVICINIESFTCT